MSIQWIAASLRQPLVGSEFIVGRHLAPHLVGSYRPKPPGLTSKSGGDLSLHAV